jgi:hypothetical protein
MAAKGRKSGEDLDEVKKEFLKQLHKGLNINQALAVVGRTRTTYERWRRTDQDFVVSVERIKNLERIHGTGEVERVYMPFPEFSEKYLGAKVFPHMQNVVDMIEGREPSWTHPSMVFEAGERDLVMVNMPPEHAKTTSYHYQLCGVPDLHGPEHPCDPRVEDR